VLPDGQDARFDANGSAQCNAKTSGNIPGQLNETRWIYCPSVPPNDAISLNAIWDNPDPGNTTVLVSANNGTGASKSSGVPTPPPDAKWENLGPIDVLSQSTASGPGD